MVASGNCFQDSNYSTRVKFVLCFDRRVKLRYEFAVFNVDDLYGRYNDRIIKAKSLIFSYLRGRGKKSAYRVEDLFFTFKRFLLLSEYKSKKDRTLKAIINILCYELFVNIKHPRRGF